MLIDSCVQVRLSLFFYGSNGMWRKLTNLHKETATEKALAEPIFTRRAGTSLASFDDRLILITGGSHLKVFCYDIRSDKWKKAPAMNQNHIYHSSTVLNTSLYVYSSFGLERMVNVNTLIGE